ncbi:hypothetical protein [Sphingomonas aracearum]|uniref:Lipoprotein n=1 Tax=Sphingomonas aracearum TaxID=2283317 RepID=A0A369VXN4_9SPHN|nr:hypothetical protein [Sphingomonas aracearum]RDE06599.1 hypothetical protein DVW87_02520 [Sphingomonas aracearum]
MSTRISSTIAVLLLAGCGGQGASNQIAENSTAPGVQPATARNAADGRVPCAEGGAQLEPVCTVDQERGQQGLLLTLRHPGGAFRRLLVTRDGRGVVAADGAEPARVRVLDAGRIEVALGNARYELPATVKAGAR